MYSTDAILEAVLLIRPRLNDLLGSETAQQVNTQLLHLLSRMQADEPVENQLLALLAQYEPTRVEMAVLLGREYEGDQTRTTKGISFTPLPGESTPLPKPQFRCPICGYTWSRLKVGKPIPFCKQHKVPLEPITQ